MFKIYKGKKVLITGHTGFKGSWLSLWLTKLGAEVCGYSKEPPTTPSMFNELNIASQIKQSAIGDILDTETLEKIFQEFEPDIVFHLAAQPLVRLSYREPLLTYQTNVIGTLNVLEAARKTKSIKAFVNITTDKCYENKETNIGYTENAPMGGYDMYSSSKGCVEIMSASYRRSFLQNSYLMATARAGNVIGGGDWALDRLIPDCVRAIQADEAITLRNPQATRPWQFVLEPLSGYLMLGEKLLNSEEKFATGFNFGPDENGVKTVKEVVEKFIQNYGKGQVIIKNDNRLHEATLLTLNINKAQKELHWTPTYNSDTAISKTADWYKNYYKEQNMLKFTYNQIEDFQYLCETKNHEL